VTSYPRTERSGPGATQYPGGNGASRPGDDAVYPEENGHVRTRQFTGARDGQVGQHTAREGRPSDGLDTPAQTVDHRIADPAPLGLGAFALTTFVLSVFNAGMLSESLEVVVLPLALFYGGIAQMLAGMWEFKKGNTFGATAFSSFGAFWLSYAAYAKFVLPGIAQQPDAHKATGLFLLAWSIFAAMLFFAAIRISGALALVFATATSAFILLTIGKFAQDTSITHLGGIMGLVTAGCAWYTSWAGVLNDAWKRTVLPIFEVKPRS
jgi:succinate-acetate transporter protein